MQQDLTGLFNAYVGKDIDIDVTPMQGIYNGNVYTIADTNQQIVKDIQKTADDNGIRLRFILPNTAYTMDYDLSRVNVQIAPVDDKETQWKIQGFGLG